MNYRTPDRSELTEGLSVQWLFTPRGGYGYTQPVPATVVKVSPKRVLIDALKKDGTTAARWVRPGKLRVAS